MRQRLPHVLAKRHARRTRGAQRRTTPGVTREHGPVGEGQERAQGERPPSPWRPPPCKHLQQMNFGGRRGSWLHESRSKRKRTSGPEIFIILKKKGSESSVSERLRESLSRSPTRSLGAHCFNGQALMIMLFIGSRARMRENPRFSLSLSRARGVIVIFSPCGAVSNRLFFSRSKH